MEGLFTGKPTNSVMEINGLKCELNMPKALKRVNDSKGKELAQGLPPYNRRPAFAVDEYPACPDNWMKGSPTEASYFVPVLSGHGMWLDFNLNANHTHYVAALISIQGVSAITGQKTQEMKLEQYRKNCPVHNVPFGQERFCKECGYKWDSQNYLASNAQPPGYFWLDGFRAQDGMVRQFVFTEETLRGIAAQIIGKERVFAIGVAFFLSKEPKPQPATVPLMRTEFSTLDSDLHIKGGVYRSPVMRRMLAAQRGPEDTLHSQALLSMSSSQSEKLAAEEVPEELPEDALSEQEKAVVEGKPTKKKQKKLEISAGAHINQRIHPDPLDLDKWQEKPSGIIYINYVDEETARTIIEAGKIDTTAHGEGFMQNLKVGNPG